MQQLKGVDQNDFLSLSQLRIESEIAWIEQKLIEKFKNIDKKLIEPLRNLSIEQLEVLSEEFADLFRLADVRDWLEDKVKFSSQPLFYQSIIDYIEHLEKQEGKLQAKVEGIRESVIEVLQIRFKKVPNTIIENINLINDVSVLKSLLRNAMAVPSIKTFTELYSLKEKIDAAVETSQESQPIDGKKFIHEIIEDFRKD
ncbi:MAG: DUF4351 domain-containing protein [Cyanobacteria bacterium J06649_11]